MAEVIRPITYSGWKIVDANTLTTGAVYAGDNSTNVPAEYCMILTLGTGDRAQLAISRSNGKVYTRTAIPGEWTEL